jgi:hypothetical protein
MFHLKALARMSNDAVPASGPCQNNLLAALPGIEWKCMQPNHSVLTVQRVSADTGLRVYSPRLCCDSIAINLNAGVGYGTSMG